MLKLWGRTSSSNVMKVLWALDELALPYERVDVGGAFGGTATPAYRAMNPLGVIPTLDDSGFTVFESNVILRYLCNAHAVHSPLYPTAPAARATVEMWMDFQQTALTRPQSALFQGLVRTPPEKRDMAVIAAAIADAARIWTILDARLAHRPFVTGEELSLADIAFGPHVHRWLKLSFDGRPELVHLQAWYDRLVARPAYVAHCAVAIT